MDNVTVRDNGGKTADRYTVTFWEHEITVSSSDSPTHPMGVWSWNQFCECDVRFLDYCKGDYDNLEEGDDPHENFELLRDIVGPAIEWDMLPESLRTYLVSWIADIKD